MDGQINIDIVGLLGSRRDGDDFVMTQIDGNGDDDPASPNACRLSSLQQFHPLGFSAMPLDADKRGQCQALRIGIGDEDYVIALDDPRATAKLPPISPGESIMYGALGQFVRCRRDGSVSLFTTSTGDTGDQDAQSVFFSVRPNAFQTSAPWGRELFDATGWHVVHGCGAEIHAGYMAGLPAPFASLTSYVDIVAGTTRIKTASLDIGQSPLLKDHLAHATPIVMALIEIIKSIGYCASAPGVNPLITESISTLIGYLTAMLAEGAVPASLPKLRSIVTSD